MTHELFNHAVIWYSCHIFVHSSLS